MLSTSCNSHQTKLTSRLILLDARIEGVRVLLSRLHGVRSDYSDPFDFLQFGNLEKRDMSESIVSDNWALQDISSLLVDGMDPSTSLSVRVNRQSNSHHYVETPQAVTQTEALFDLITDIILRDQILVDEKFIYTWSELASPIDKAVEAGVIKPYPFLVDSKKLVGPRDEFVERLCITESLKQQHKENVFGWNMHRDTPHAHLSQTLWGGAGMLARGFVYEKSYTPHPARRRLFIEAGIALEPGDAMVQLTNVIREKRAQIFSTMLQKDELHTLDVTMSPLPALVISEAESVDDLISIALDMRDDYEELRDWLRNYQQVLSDGSYTDSKKFQDILQSISLYVDSKLGKLDSNAPTFTASLGVLKVSLKARPVNDLRNQFGVRAMINKLIFSESGNSLLKKYLSLFDERSSLTGLKVLDHFSQREA